MKPNSLKKIARIFVLLSMQGCGVKTPPSPLLPGGDPRYSEELELRKAQEDERVRQEKLADEKERIREK